MPITRRVSTATDDEIRARSRSQTKETMKMNGATAEVEAQRAVMFATSRPYAFASRVRGEVPSQRVWPESKREARVLTMMTILLRARRRRCLIRIRE